VLQRAFKEALSPPTRPVFLSIPWDFTLAPAQDGPPHVTRVGSHFLGDPAEVQRAAGLLAAATNPIVVVGDGVGAADAWQEIEALAERVGAPVWAESLQSYLNFPNDQYRWQAELPQTQAKMQAVFQPHDVAFLCGYNAQAQVLVFDYSLGPMIPATVSQIYLHDDPWEIGKNGYGEAAILGDIKATLPPLTEAIVNCPGYDASAVAQRNEALQQRHGERRATIDSQVQVLSERDPASLSTGDDIALALAALQPDMPAPLMLSNEAVSDVGAFESHISYQDPASYFFGVGGSLGFSMPAALGMKLATGESRTVVNVVGDGSALFYPHAWWTARRFDLPILFVITNNREYKTLLLGLQALEAIYKWSPAGEPWYLHLDNPPMSFVDLAKPFGIEGDLVETVGDLGTKLAAALDVVKAGQPFVLEVLTDPSLAPPKATTPFGALLATKEEDRVGTASGLDYFGPA
jgi:benzoylformate decarboxylase